MRNLSIEDQALQLPDSFQRAVARAIDSLPQGGSVAARNRGEIFRQFVGCMMAKLDLTIARAETADPPPAGSAPEEPGYPNADRLIEDIDLMREALEAAGARRLSDALLLPLRREVGIFRFSTVRLDVRENSMRVNQTLAAMFRVRHGGAEPPQTGLGRLESVAESRSSAAPRAEPRATTGCPPRRRKRSNVPHHRPHARGDRPRSLWRVSILSMTRSAADILGVYLLAKEGGLFADAAGGRALHPADRAPARDHSRFAPAPAILRSCWTCRWCSAASTCRAMSRKS